MPALVSLVLQTSGVLHQLLGLISSALFHAYRARYIPVRTATAIDPFHPLFIHRTAVNSQTVACPCLSDAGCITYRGGNDSV